MVSLMVSYFVLSFVPRDVLDEIWGRIIEVPESNGYDYYRTSNVFVDVDVGGQNRYFSFSLILDKNTTTTVVQKLMQEFAFTINIECLHSKLLVKLLMHKCLRAKHMKTYTVELWWLEH